MTVLIISVIKGVKFNNCHSKHKLLLLFDMHQAKIVSQTGLIYLIVALLWFSFFFFFIFALQKISKVITLIEESRLEEYCREF